MKKNYILLLLFVIQVTQAQLSENFDSQVPFPSGWAVYNGANNIGLNFIWFTGTDRYYSASRCAEVRYENVGTNTAEDWLVTPLVDLTNRTNSSLSFYGGQTYSAENGSVLQIKVSTTIQSNQASYTTVATFTESQFTSGLTPLTSLQTVDLSAYNNQQIYIAFVVVHQGFGDDWSIDDVNVTGTLGNNSFNLNQITIYPNPTNGILQVDTKDNIAKIEIYNLLGNLIKTEINSNKIDLSELAVGAYYTKITSTEGKVKTKKIIKN